jgi:hypothetical protein
MRPTNGMHHSRPADLIVRCVPVGLQNAFELPQKLFWPIASTPETEVER